MAPLPLAGLLLPKPLEGPWKRFVISNMLPYAMIPHSKHSPLQEFLQDLSAQTNLFCLNDCRNRCLAVMHIIVIAVICLALPTSKNSGKPQDVSTSPSFGAAAVGPALSPCFPADSLRNASFEVADQIVQSWVHWLLCISPLA